MQVKISPGVCMSAAAGTVVCLFSQSVVHMHAIMRWVLVSVSTLLVLAVEAAVKDVSSSISCSNIKPIKDLVVPQLRGGWVALESMSFPRGPGDKQEGEDSRSTWRARVCIHAELLNVTDRGLSMLSELHLPGDEGDIEIARNLFTVDQQESARWTVVSNFPNLQGSEMLVISCDPKTYMALVLCLPPPPPAGQMDWVPDKDGERFVSTVSLLARRQDRDRGKLTARKVKQIRAEIAKILGLSKFESQKYDTRC